MASELCCIEQLPEELLRLILLYVKHQIRDEDWWSGCMRTCRKWHRIGLGLYEGLGFAMSTIVGSNISRQDVKEEHPSSNLLLTTDFELQPPSEFYLSQLRSLTIHVRHQHIASPFAPRPKTDLVENLTTNFLYMRRLLVFSIKFADGWDFPSMDVPAVPQSLLARLVAALPYSVLDLELDTAGADIPPSAELIVQDVSNHLCHQINHILCRLRHLRLRTGHICSHLLSLQPDVPPCSKDQNCAYCSKGAPSTCKLLSCWNMRTMVVWLPWGQEPTTNSFAQASVLLLDHTLPNPTTILLIHQEAQSNPHLENFMTPGLSAYTRFYWTPQTNASPALQSRLDYFTFKPVRGIVCYVPDLAASNVIDTSLTPIRDFLLTLARNSQVPEVGGETAYPFLATATIEAMLSWTQRGYLSYRFPISESATESKMWYRVPKLWYCQLPHCKERGPVASLANLRGHVLYSHPRQPHQAILSHCCPFYGCDKVWGDKEERERELEAHTRGHVQVHEVDSSDV